MEVIKRERLIKNIHSMVRGYKSCVNESAKLSQVNAIINEVLFSVESDHKAVVETMQKDHARSLWIKDDVIGDLEAIIEEKKKVIMLLKAENYDLTKGIK